MPIFERMIGLETEYAVRREHGPRGRSVRAVYFALVDQLRSRLPLAKADFTKASKLGVFLANGGAVWLEQPLPGAADGLIEGSTPECRSPRDVLIWQRAQDRLLGTVVRDDSVSCGLIKNCRDPHGRSYGAQENYEFEFATGWRLRAWRLGASLGMLVHLAVILMAACVLVPLLCVGFCLECFRRLVRPTHSDPHDKLYRYWNGHEAQFAMFPDFLGRVMIWLLSIIAMPSITYITLLTRVTNLPRVIRLMTPFLVTRGVFAGAGGLDRRGKFHLAEKALSRQYLWQSPLVDTTHGVISLGNLFKAAIGVFNNPQHGSNLIASRQRLQIGLGDSNMCETAEYLRVATTALVLDAIEAGAILSVPELKRPMKSLHVFNADDTLTAKRPVVCGGEMTALEIQRCYWRLCDRFVHNTPDAPAEARAVLRKWRRVLDDLEEDPDQLIGQIDWVTKRWLLSTAGAGLTVDDRRAMAIRYHELAPDGHFFRLRDAGVICDLVSDRELDIALRTAPSNTRAADRARRIREFSGEGADLVMSWDTVPQQTSASN